MVNVTYNSKAPESSIPIHPISLPFINTADATTLKLADKVVVVSFTRVLTKPGLPDSVELMSSGTVNVYICSPLEVHLKKLDAALAVHVNTTVSSGHGLSWAKPCLLVSDGITVYDMSPACTSIGFQNLKACKWYKNTSIYMPYLRDHLS